MSDIKPKLRALISEVFQIPAEEVSDEASFEDLGLDSLDALRLVASIEREFDIEIPEEDIPRVEVIGDIYSLVDKRISA